MIVKIAKNELDKSGLMTTGKANDGDKQLTVPGIISSEVLFAGRREVLIKHATESYRLRITNQGKLILTK